MQNLTEIPFPFPYQSNQGVGPFKVVKKIAESSAKIFLISTIKDETDYILKIFPQDCRGLPSRKYLNESRFQFLKHPNVISIKEANPNRLDKTSGKNISYLVLEYAQYGDFRKLFKSKLYKDEKLVRTYFRQFIEGLSYIHDQGVRHLDLKLDNLLWNDKFILKIADFDLSYMKNDEKVQSQGTSGYRAPELIDGNAKDLVAVDIFSAGIILFVLATGALPYSEEEDPIGSDLQMLFLTQDEKFWKIHSEEADCPRVKNKDLRALIFQMTNEDPKLRPSIQEIKKNQWFSGSIYSQPELEKVMNKLFYTNP